MSEKTVKVVKLTILMDASGNGFLAQLEQPPDDISVKKDTYPLINCSGWTGSQVITAFNPSNNLDTLILNIFTCLGSSPTTTISPTIATISPTTTVSPTTTISPTTTVSPVSPTTTTLTSQLLQELKSKQHTITGPGKTTSQTIPASPSTKINPVSHQEEEQKEKKTPSSLTTQLENSNPFQQLKAAANNKQDSSSDDSSSNSFSSTGGKRKRPRNITIKKRINVTTV